MSESEPDRDDRSDDGGGIRFWLPPLTLPEAVFPSDLRVSLPAPGVERRVSLSGARLLVAALAFDAFDAAFALWATDPVVVWGRVLGGIGVAALATGVYATLYAWEAAAVAAGFSALTAFPSLTVLLLLRGRR
jgi:hypothetical protein